MTTPGSPDISTLSVLVEWDISGNVPKIVLTNESTGPHLANVSYAFLVKSPSQTDIHDGNINTPDITGVWTTETLDDPWPRPWNQIEWSGADYTIQIFAKDSVGNIYEYIVGQQICRPVGNINTSITTYGKGIVSINVNCANASAFFEDISNTSYKGLSGTQTASQLKVIYPDDETDTAPEPFIVSSFSSAVVSVTYDSNNYEFVYSSVYVYYFPDGSSVKIKYYTKQRFSILCNIDLCPLVCEYVKLLDKYERGDCQDQADIQRKLILINGKLELCMIGKTQPMCGIDVPLLIEEIKLIGGFDCDCCAPSGIAPFNGTTLLDYNFTIVSGGGDISGTVTTTGTNIQFTLFDKSYVFRISPSCPTTAFAVIPTTAGFTKTYFLNVDMTVLATDLANTIIADPDLVNLWSFLTGDINRFVVDGKCIFESIPACDYTFTLPHIPNDSSFARIIFVGYNGGGSDDPFAFNSSNLSGLQAYFNELNIGTWTVSEPVSGTILIESEANPNTVTGIQYAVLPTYYLASLSKVCGSYVPVTGNYVLQQIIDYICALDDSKIITSQDYVICYIDPADNIRKTSTVAGGEELTAFIVELLSKGCDTIEYVTSLSKLNCENIQALFPTSASVIQGTDYLLASKSASCARVFPTELFLSMLQLGSYNAEVIAAFCNMVALCATGQVCEPYTVFNVDVETYDADCPSIIDFEYSVAGTNLQITKIDFANTPTSAQVVTIEYKLSTDVSYTLYSATVNVNTDGTLPIPANITVSEGLTYNVKITDNCSSPAEGIVKTIIIPGEPVTGNIDVDNQSIKAIAIDTIFVNGVSVEGGSFPVNQGEETTAVTTQIGTYTVAIHIITGFTGDCLQISDSNGTSYSQGIAGTDTYTFTNIVINTTDPVTILITDGACP